jgi:DNA polymerase-3 subunit epsilon
MFARRRPLRECNLFFFDCETGGLNAGTSDMLEVAAIVTDPTGREVIEEYCTKVFPKKPVDAKAAEINGYTAEKWAAEAVELDTAMVKMLTMANGSVFTAHNAPFDWSFFNHAMVERYQRWPGDYHRVDTVALAWPLLCAGEVDSVKLTTLTKYFGIEHSAAHTALSDARACREVYVRLMGIYGPSVAALKR